MKLNRYALVLFISILFLQFVACKSSQKSSKVETSQSEYNSTKVSPEVNKLILALDDEMASSADEFEPSKSLINQYRLKKLEDQYYVGGLAKMEKKSEKSILEEKGCKVATQAGNIWTVLIPIKKLKETVSLDQVLYFESKAANLKTK